MHSTVTPATAGALARRSTRMARSRSAHIASLGAASVLLLATAGCGGDDGGSDGGSDGGGGSASGDGGSVGVILPDATTSPRWEANDRPSLQKAFEDAGIKA